MTQDSQYCRKCLLNELDDRKLFEYVTDYIANLPEESKTPSDEYNRRLAICKACNHLVNGMCALCGCFVEVRAAKINQYCAKTQRYW